MSVPHATGSPRAWLRWAAPVRLAADTGLLVLAAAWGAWSSAYGLWLWTALSLGWMADALWWSRGVRPFLAALACVLLARVALVAGFGALQPTVRVSAIALAVLLAATVLFTLRPFVGAFPVRLRRPAVAFLGTLVVLVASAAGAADATGRWRLLLGAVLLAVADLFVVRQRFVRRSWVNDAVGLPLHYGALVLLLYPYAL